MKNDISILLDSYMFLFEQQSTINPNMPVRGFMYFGEVYSAYIDEKKLNVYGSSVIHIPTPRYVVLYNGTKDAPEVVKYRMSDSFINDDRSGDFEWTATMININPGKNDELVEKCRPLKEYMTLVGYIREYRGKCRSEVEGIDMAVDRCVREGILVDFLAKHRAEVRKMIITDQKRQIEILEADAERRGIEQGIEKMAVLLQKQGQSREYIISTLEELFNLDSNEAEKYIQHN